MLYAVSFIAGALLALLIHTICIASSHRDDDTELLKQALFLDKALDEACTLLSHDGVEPSASDWKKYLIYKVSK